MQHIKHVIISAAGMGSRLGLDIPKCLVDIDGKKLIDYQLDLVKDIPDVRIVVGFKEEELIDYVRKIRSDVLFVRNPDYINTSNSYSIELACWELKEPFIIIDGDLLIEPHSFKNFTKNCIPGQDLIGVTKTKTEEAVFIELNKNNEITSFSFDKKSPYEWSGIAYLSTFKITRTEGFVFKKIEEHLPLKSFEIDCYEIDTPADLNFAIKHFNSNFCTLRG